MQTQPPEPSLHPNDAINAAAEGIAREHELIEADLLRNRVKNADPLRQREADAASRNETMLRVMLREVA